MKHFKISILILVFALISACNSDQKVENVTDPETSQTNIDQLLPIFMSNEANTKLYKEASVDSEIISTIPEEDNLVLIGLTAVKDAANKTWYKCYYPKEQVEGWTLQVSHGNYSDDKSRLPFIQNLTQAYLKFGANPKEAKRLLGKPNTESSETGPLETSGYVDEDDIVTTTTMQYDGLQLIYQDDYLIHAEITKPGKSFGWITVGDKAWNKNTIMKKFNLTEENFYDEGEGVRVINMYADILSLSLFLDADDLVKKIEFHFGS